MTLLTFYVGVFSPFLIPLPKPFVFHHQPLPFTLIPFLKLVTSIYNCCWTSVSWWCINTKDFTHQNTNSLSSPAILPFLLTSENFSLTIKIFVWNSRVISNSTFSLFYHINSITSSMYSTSSLSNYFFPSFPTTNNLIKLLDFIFHLEYRNRLSVYLLISILVSLIVLF